MSDASSVGGGDGVPLSLSLSQSSSLTTLMVLRCTEVSPCEFEVGKDSAKRERTRREVDVSEEEWTAQLKQVERVKAWRRCSSEKGKVTKVHGDGEGDEGCK